MSSWQMVQRLMWKDYRALRVIWFACAVAPIMLMLLLYIIHRLQNPTLPVSPISYWGLAIWIPPIYLLAAIGTMFAGAREEGTLTWLTILSPPLHTLVGAQLAFGIVTALVMQLILGGTAGAITNFETGPLEMAPGDVVFLMVFLLGEAAIWGWFWSLQTSKVLQAILDAAFSVAFINFANGVYWSNFGGGSIQTWGLTFRNVFGIGGWGRELLYVALIPICMKLSDRWLNGRPVDWSGAAGWWTSRGKTIAVPVRKAEPVDSWRRVWQRLRWREWQAMRPWRTAVYVATGLSCVTLLFGKPATFAMAVVLSWVIPFVAGLAAWQGEQHQSRYRMLAWRGVSPGAVWWNKLLFWSGFAIGSVFFLDVVTLGCWELLSAGERWLDPMMKVSRWPTVLFGHSWYWPSLYELRASEELNALLRYGILFLSALASVFAVPFVCAHYVQRTVVAFGASAAAASVIIPWFVLIEQYRLPPLWFLAPIPFWLLWLSWRHLPAWWLECTSWRLTRREALELSVAVIFPLAMLPLALGYRVWEVPLVDLRDYSKDLFGREIMVDRPVEAGVADWSDVEEEMIRLNRLMWQRSENSMQDGAEVPGQQNTADLLLPADLELVRRLVLSQTEPATRTGTFARLHISTIWHIALKILELAKQQLAEGAAEESIHSVRAALRLAGATQRQFYFDKVVNTRPLFASLQAWCCHPQQTEEILVKGLQACARELPYWQVSFDELEYQRQLELQGVHDIYWSWERARARRLVNLAYANRWTYLRRVRQDELLPASLHAYAPGTISEPGHNPLIDFRAVGSRQYQGFSPVGLDLGEIWSLFSQEADFRARLTVSALMGYRHLHGELPATLNPLLHWFEGLDVPYLYHSGDHSWDHQSLSPLLDLWSGETFGYKPEGFAVGPQFLEDSMYRQPLIWTVGPDRSRPSVRRGTIIQKSQSRYSSGYTIFTDRTPEKLSTNWIYVIPPEPAETP